MIGDFAAGDIIDFKFTTRRFTTGVPFTLAGSPALRVYKSNSTTQSTTGVTLTADFDSVTGLNHARIDTSADGTFYADGSQFDVVIEAGTIDSVSVVGEIVGRFTLRAQAHLYPTTAGRKLDVSATGEAGVDWANVGSPTTTLNLSGTTVKTAADVETDTQDIQSRLPAALVSGRIDASVGAMAANVLTATAINADAITAAKIADGAIDAATFAAGAINAAAIAADAITAAKVADGAIDAATFAAGAINAAAIAADAITDAKVAADVTIASVTGAVGSVTGAVGSVTGNVGGNVTGSVGSVATGGIAAASFAAGAIDAAAIATDALGALELAAGAASEIASAVRTELTTELGRIDAAVSTRATQASVDTIDDFLDTEVAAIKAKTDQLTFSTANRVDAQVFGMEAGTVSAAAIATDAIDADAIKTDAITEIQAGLSTLNAAGVRTAVGLATANLDTQLDALPTAAENADAVWDEAIADHTDIGSTGEALSDAAAAGGTPPTVAEIADEVETRTIAAVTVVNGLAANTVTASALATDAVTEIVSATWAKVIETGYSAEQVMRILSAVAAGKTLIAPLSPGALVTFRDLNDTADRVVAEMTSDPAERADVTLTP